MINETFQNLVLIIFRQTFGILKYHNDRTGLFESLFPSYQLGRDIEKIKNWEPIPDPTIYISAINEFFRGDPDVCVEKTTQLIGLLTSAGYIKDFEGPDILSKCDKNTLNIYHELILDIWDFYYTQYSSKTHNHVEIYSISQNILDNLIKKYTKFHLPVSLEFYQQRIPDIIELLRTKNPDALYSSIETEYIYLFKNVLENNSFYTLSRKDRVVFFNTLYAISDILDKAHHKDSYRINLEVMNFLNTIYNDDYTNISVDDIRRIQGCIYAISIETTDESLKGNIKLTSNNNIVRIESNYKPITFKAKLDMCDKALRNLLNNKYLKKQDRYFNEATYISLYENRLQRNRDIKPEEIKELYVLSLVYSNIAACTLQYIKQQINVDSKYDGYVEICETYHDRSRYIRTLIVRIVGKMNGNESAEYKDALHFLATYYHSVATRYFYMRKYSDVILIRSVLYSFYMSLNLKEKAREQLSLTPINLYEQYGGNNKLFEQTTKALSKECKKDFSYLFCKTTFSYDEFRDLVINYHKFKELF